ncbi:hypothetical protein LOK49_LG15G02117 [Camellia lanceoleosa]|uniref:Uncharacterized protein n=1 Tax=Camellia lanceoleosa TaxID=1840588 RepID=A0ACC0F3S4_9ERIC|nr:hypothetical protein LOK49_LG15G02117 [Camellia lanceoleosa]
MVPAFGSFATAATSATNYPATMAAAPPNTTAFLPLPLSFFKHAPSSLTFEAFNHDNPPGGRGWLLKVVGCWPQLSHPAIRLRIEKTNY